jgi:hypothetical protein
LLVGKPEQRALPRVYRIAGEKDANILVADGLSIRELLVIKKALPGRVTYSAGLAIHHIFGGPLLLRHKQLRRGLPRKQADRGA